MVTLPGDGVREIFHRESVSYAQGSSLDSLLRKTVAVPGRVRDHTRQCTASTAQNHTLQSTLCHLACTCACMNARTNVPGFCITPAAILNPKRIEQVDTEHGPWSEN